MKPLNFIAGAWQPAGQGRAFEVRRTTGDSKESIAFRLEAGRSRERPHEYLFQGGLA